MRKYHLDLWEYCGKSMGVLPSGNYSRLEESVGVGKGLGVRGGEKEGPLGVTSKLQSPKFELVLAAGSFHVKFVCCCGHWNPSPFPAGWETHGEINPQIKVWCFNPTSAWSGADCKLFPEEILMGSWGLYQFFFETSGTSPSFVRGCLQLNSLMCLVLGKSILGEGFFRYQHYWWGLIRIIADGLSWLKLSESKYQG